LFDGISLLTMLVGQSQNLFSATIGLVGEFRFKPTHGQKITPALCQKTAHLISTKEQEPLVFKSLKSVRGTLLSGDYSVAGLEELFNVERKSISDPVSCCIGLNPNYIEHQLHRLRGYPRGVGRLSFRDFVILGTWDAGRALLSFFANSRGSSTTVRITAHFSGFENDVTHSWMEWPMKGVLENVLLDPDREGSHWFGTMIFRRTPAHPSSQIQTLNP
jgi:hypothetical protein